MISSQCLVDESLEMAQESPKQRYWVREGFYPFWFCSTKYWVSLLSDTAVNERVWYPKSVCFFNLKQILRFLVKKVVEFVEARLEVLCALMRLVDRQNLTFCKDQRAVRNVLVCGNSGCLK